MRVLCRAKGLFHTKDLLVHLGNGDRHLDAMIIKSPWATKNYPYDRRRKMEKTTTYDCKFAEGMDVAADCKAEEQTKN